MTSLLTDIKKALHAEFSDFTILTQYDTEDKTPPCILIESEATSERIKGNRTWDVQAKLSLIVNAHDWTEEQIQACTKQLVAYSQGFLITDLRLLPAQDYILYSVLLDSVSAPSVEDTLIVQSINLNILLQQ